MSSYRDVDAKLRIETLEAKLAERDASLRAREVEMEELRARLEEATRGKAGSGRGAKTGPWIVAGMAFAAVVGMGVTIVQQKARSAESRALFEETAARSEARLAEADARSAEAARRLDLAERRLQDCQAEKREPPPPPAEPQEAGGDFDRTAAVAALREVDSKVRLCRTSPSTPETGKVTITFAPDGRASSVTVDGPLQGTSTGACVAAAFRNAKVPPFSGGPVTVSRTVKIGP